MAQINDAWIGLFDPFFRAAARGLAKPRDFQKRSQDAFFAKRPPTPAPLPCLPWPVKQMKRGQRKFRKTPLFRDRSRKTLRSQDVGNL